MRRGSLLLAVLVLGSLAAAPPPSSLSGAWPTLETVLPAAAGADRPILLEFFKPDCHYCQLLHEKIWGEESIEKLLDPATKARADISTPAGGALAERMKITLFPTILLVDPAGHTLDRMDGLPELAAARAFLERAAARRITLPDDPLAWQELGDFAADAGIPKLAEETYRRVAEDSRTPPERADGARLKRARTQERLGDLAGAAATLEKFTATEAPGTSGTLRPALDLLIRVRKGLGDREGETRAREAFARLFPELHPPD